jgi:thiol-disulfide isomerase/thioredoxin
MNKPYALRRRLLAALALGGIAQHSGLIDVLAQASSGGTTPAPTPTPGSMPDWGLMPELRGLSDWFNGGPMDKAALQGQVVLVDFWALGCSNCRNALPHVAQWHEKYKDKGLVVLGIHAPEFDAERPVAAVKQAAARLKLNFPIALDNNFETWRAFRNEYWPAHYFVDVRGHIRHRHYGEGEYAYGEQVIQALLAERAASPRA